MTTEKTWSPQQGAAFDFFLDPARKHAVVIARAGTGKTTTILEAVRRLLEARPGTKVLVCAFNKSIQTELQSRLPPGADCSTFHSLGLRALKSAWGGLTVKPERDMQMVREALPDDPPYEALQDVKKLASLAMNTLVDSDADMIELMSQHNISPCAEYSEELYTRWAQKVLLTAEQKSSEVSYDQMIYVPAKKGWRTGKYDFVIVDETQDMNAAQLKLCMAALAPDGRFIAVGDPSQAIYVFRGADSGSIERIQRELKADILNLSITYRCPRAVVDLANKIVPDLEAAASAPEGSVEHVGEGAFIAGAKGGDFVLSRTNAPLAKYCLKFLAAGRPAYIQGREVGGTLKTLIKKARRAKIVDLMEWMREWQIREVRRLKAAGKDAKCDEVSDKFEAIFALSEGLADTEQLYTRIDKLFSDGDPRGKVMFSSVHKAKGLEAKTVWCLEPTFKPGKNQEEDNLCYVAWTRSQDRLVLVDAPAKKDSHRRREEEEQ